MLELDWVLYAAHCDLVGNFAVCASGWDGYFCFDGGFRDLVHSGLYEVAGGAGFLRGRAPRVDCVRLFLDLYVVFVACYILIRCRLFLCLANCGYILWVIYSVRL